MARVHPRIVRGEGNRSGMTQQSLLETLQMGQCHGEVRQCLDPVRIQPYCRLISPRSTGVILQTGQCGAEIDLRIVRIWLQLQGLPAAFRGQLILLEVQQCAAELDVGFQEIRSLSDSLAGRFRSSFGVAREPLRPRQVGQSLGKCWSSEQRLGNELYRAYRSAAFVSNDPEHVEGIGLIRVASQNFVERGIGGIQPASSKRGDSGLQIAKNL